jgi:thiol:disulfide interchange protein/DsbC/DsbD-like thiol-disulfide interchange protein
MTHIIKLLLALVSFILGAGSDAHAQDISPTASSTNVEVTLKSTRINVLPGETFYVALDQKIANGWHTYWRNPGDSGEPTNISWTLPKGVTASAIKWPTPTALPFGPLVNYGFSNQVLLPVEVSVPKSAKVGDILTLIADVSWLECADVCIPGDAKVGLKVTVAASSTTGIDEKQIANSVAALPAQFPGSTRLTDLGPGGLQLIIKGMEAAGGAYFFPYEIKTGAVIDFAQPQELVTGKDGYGLTLVKSPSYPTDLKGPVRGVLVIGKGRETNAYEIAADFDGVSASSQSGTQREPSTPKSLATPKSVGQPNAGIGLWLALAMAFVGGLILNLMPCVFPILSMKALGLIEASHGDARAARANGVWYGVGVVFSFVALAAALIGLKSAGFAVGWGFQLQDPLIVIGLAILMVWIGFNLLGFFEFGSALQNIGSGIPRTNNQEKGLNEGIGGSFLTGVLAVVVAAPCTAPFMGAALGFAATQTPIISLIVFVALGIGFALPFVALTFMPSLLRALPRPGPWMVRLREGLAFPMFATAIWLIWVASAQVGQAGVLAALIGVLGAGAAVWLLRTWPTFAGKLLALVIGLGSVLWAAQHAHMAPRTKSLSVSDQGNVWSEQRVAQLQSEGKTVFVNFTADWCVTCKVNEVGVFSDPDVKNALSGENAVYLIADWTNRDEAIARALTSHGRVGVPLYLVYNPNQSQPQILPQILTKGLLLGALQ